MIVTHGMSSQLLANKRENLRRRRKWSDTRTPRRDATCMSRTSHQPPLTNNSMSYSLSSVKLKVLEFSPRKVRLFMLSYASRLLSQLLKLKLHYTNRTSTVNNYTSTTTKSKKSESNNMRRCTIRPISKTIRNKTLICQKSWTNLKSLPSSINWSNYCNQRWWCKTDNKDQTNQELEVCKDKECHPCKCHSQVAQVFQVKTQCNNQWWWATNQTQWWDHQWWTKCRCHHKWWWVNNSVLMLNTYKRPCQLFPLFTQITLTTRHKLEKSSMNL
jgi:hypothetical protein